MSVINVAKTVGINAVKMDLSFGAFDATISVSVAALGGNLAKSNAPPEGISSRSQSPGSMGKSQSSFSLVGNYTPSEYLNVGVSGASFR